MLTMSAPFSSWYISLALKRALFKLIWSRMCLICPSTREYYSFIMVSLLNVINVTAKKFTKVALSSKEKMLYQILSVSNN